jgi:hypothetical protein
VNNGQSSENPPTLSVSTAALKAARRLDQLAARPGVYRLLWVIDESGNRYLVESAAKLEKVS